MKLYENFYNDGTLTNFYGGKTDSGYKLKINKNKMKVTTNEQGVIQLEEVFSGIILKTKDGEEMSICMRDSGFEFNYQGEWYFAKEGFVKPFKEDKINVPTQEDYYQQYDKLVRQKVEMLVVPGPAHLARMSERDRYTPTDPQTPVSTGQGFLGGRD